MSKDILKLLKNGKSLTLTVKTILDIFNTFDNFLSWCFMEKINYYIERRKMQITISR